MKKEFYIMNNFEVCVFNDTFNLVTSQEERINKILLYYILGLVEVSFETPANTSREGAGDL